MIPARAFAVLLTLCLGSSALAQNPTENVTVTSQKGRDVPPERVLHDFIRSYTAPSPAIGKVARWRYGVCPAVTGLPPAWNKLVTTRVREIAGLAGAPVGADDCRANIDIVFTKNPQVLLDGIRAKKSFLLGYHDLANEENLARMTHPVQAWYMTQTVDATGAVHTDDKLHTQGIYLGHDYYPNAHVEHWDGTHLADGRLSELMHIMVVADLAKINGVNLAAMADYVAMMSLAQTAAFEACQPVPSIANLMAPACELKAARLTDSDLAYLHALYAIDPRDSLVQQRGQMAFEMKKSLAKDSAGAR